MHRASRAKTLTRTASTKVTPEEDRRILVQAKRCGLTKSEWCRQVLLEGLDATPGTRLLLSELMALRMVFVRLYTDVLQGIEVSDARLAAILKSADLEKFNLADRRIKTFHSNILKPEQAEAEADEEEQEEEEE